MKTSSLQHLKKMKLLKPYDPVHGIKKGWALCCPFCEECKMEVLPKGKGFKCLGSQLQICGRWLSIERAAQYKGMYVVEE